mgnify:CR=1 FL=1
MALSDRIKNCRQSAGLSQEKMAELVGVSRQAVCDNLTRTEALLRKMEANIGCIRRGQKLRKIAALIQESAGQLLDSSDEMTCELARRILSAAEEIEE